jgi:hypothetical protein
VRKRKLTSIRDAAIGGIIGSVMALIIFKYSGLSHPSMLIPLVALFVSAATALFATFRKSLGEPRKLDRL